MNDFYETDEVGKFIAMKAPPIAYQTPPTCPACRGPVTALRYGRVTKRATLDILEQNVASSMSQSLESLGATIEHISSSLNNMQALAKDISPGDVSTTGDSDGGFSARQSPLGKPTEPLAPTMLNKSAMISHHGFSSAEAKAWVDIVEELLSTYRQVVKVAKTRGAHAKAYEAARATLFRLEIEAIEKTPSQSTDTPEPLALAAMNRKIGQPPPKADSRFQIEAYFLCLELRFMLAQICRSRIEGLSMTSGDAVIQHRRLWYSFLHFIHDSCVADSKKVLAMAEESRATRQAARSSIYLLRSAFEQFRAQIVDSRTSLAASGSLTPDERRRLERRVQGEKTDILAILEQVKQRYLRDRPSRDMQDLKEERKWFDENCERKVGRWIQDCDELAKYMMTDGFYSPLSLQEREDIVKAFGFTHRGHFYNCENGHTFVISECGGAMERATCPECKAPIGGNDHRLLQSNSRAREFEAVAARQGSLPGVWNWTGMPKF